MSRSRWRTQNNDFVVVPIRIDAKGKIGKYNNINTIFDLNDDEYEKDLLRDGNTLYTKNGEDISDLLEQWREVPELKIKVTSPIETLSQTNESVKSEFENDNGQDNDIHFSLSDVPAKDLVRENRDLKRLVEDLESQFLVKYRLTPK